MVLPGDGSVPARSSHGSTSWLVGARPSVATGALARRFGASRVLDRSPVLSGAPAS